VAGNKVKSLFKRETFIIDNTLNRTSTVAYYSRLGDNLVAHVYPNGLISAHMFIIRDKKNININAVLTRETTDIIIVGQGTTGGLSTRTIKRSNNIGFAIDEAEFKAKSMEHSLGSG
jgi:hypothetical protein